MSQAKFEVSGRRMGLYLAMALSTTIANVVLAAGPENAFHIDGAVEHASNWTAAQLDKGFPAAIESVAYVSKGQKHVSKCVALLAVLKRAGVQTDLQMDPAAEPKAKNFPLRLVVVVTGRDGYVAAFSLAELLPEAGHGKAWLALDVDGNVLPQGDGPVRLIVPGDEKPARWVRAISAISIMDAAAATTQSK